MKCKKDVSGGIMNTNKYWCTMNHVQLLCLVLLRESLNEFQFHSGLRVGTAQCIGAARGCALHSANSAIEYLLEAVSKWSLVSVLFRCGQKNTHYH